MTQITIPDQLAQRIASSAAQRGCDKDELASMLIEQSLMEEEYYAQLPMTPALQAHLTSSLEAANRGELIPGDQIDQWLGELIKELESR